MVGMCVYICRIVGVLFWVWLDLILWESCFFLLKLWVVVWMKWIRKGYGLVGGGNK